MNKQNEPDDEDKGQLTQVSGSIDFCEAKFSYQPNKKLMDDFNLSIPKGSMVAIVGPTGAGKTTLVNLLMRFYDLDSGKILIDHQDISFFTKASIRRSFGMVLQDTWLTNGTIKENIAYGLPDANDEQIMEAAKNARADSFINRLENGYNTMIGEEGGNLSEGEKQLLTIARVMLMNPPMMILDEATSSVDPRTEIKIQKAMETLMNGKTSLVIAHRLSTIRNSDMILVMDKGRVVESGKHEELLKNKGLYYQLHSSQFSHIQ